MSVLDPKVNTNNEQRDVALYFNKKGDIDSIKRHNDEVIESTIKKYEEQRRRKARDHEDNVRYRVSAALDFAAHMEKGGRNDAEKYFGRKLLAELRGEDILNDIRGRVSLIGRRPIRVN